MKPVVLLGMLVALVSVQSGVLQRVSVRPDLFLIATFLVGFMRGETTGAGCGLLLGFVQDLFSAGGLWLNLMTKGAVGLFSGLAGRHLATATIAWVFGLIVVLTFLSGLIFAVPHAAAGEPGAWWLLGQTILLPEALLNATIGALLYWFIPRHDRRDDEFGQEIHLFGRSRL